MTRENDPALLDDFAVYRRIPPDPDNVQWLDDGTAKPASQNFKDRNNELSVHLVDETTPTRMLEGHDGFGLVELTLGIFRKVFSDPQCNQPLAICRDDEDPSFGHLLICGRVTNGMAKRIRDAVKWVQLPTRIEE